MRLDQLPVEILDASFGHIFREYQTCTARRCDRQLTVDHSSSQYDPLSLRLVCRRFNGIAVGRIGNELRGARHTENTATVAEGFERLAASLLAWEVGFDQEGRLSGKSAGNLYKAIRLTAESVVSFKPERDVQAQKARYWDILAKRADMHMPFMTALLRRRANPNIVHSYFGNSLHAAITRQNPTPAALLVSRNAKIQGVDKFARDALHVAAINGHASVVRSLLDGVDMFASTQATRVDPNVLDAQLRTPLIWAAAMGHASVVSALVRRKDCNVNASDRYHRTAMSWAISKGNIDVANALLSRRDLDVEREVDRQKIPTLVYAVRLHRTEILRTILHSHRTVNVNRAYIFNRTALTEAIFKGHDDIINLLLANKKVDINAYDGEGRTPLIVACDQLRQNTFNKLLATEGLNVHTNMELAIKNSCRSLLWS